MRGEIDMIRGDSHDQFGDRNIINVDWNRIRRDMKMIQNTRTGSVEM